ncbi:hypothetical protein [Actinomadura alba]|uniref:LPXTG cell wall anchor domain-containing protein n=1 Tax=Actinomadura alba TaxID=406431 RepID=A0ABR7LHF0_9ACTN|nr:hypothetical protein [Actinomadura alba]MBC6464241.1 hypothetical protein [Actinomadura alba]
MTDNQLIGLLGAAFIAGVLLLMVWATTRRQRVPRYRGWHRSHGRHR